MTKSKQRPKGVPEAARWNEAGYWSEGPLDEAGKEHGAYRHWNASGVFYCRNHYEHGTQHGENVHLHPDGSVGQHCTYEHGVASDLCFWRADVATSVEFPPVGAQVWHARYVCTDGLTNSSLHFYLRDGTEVAPDGSPIPPRPSSVCTTARYIAERQTWVDGASLRLTGARVGVWREWSADGILKQQDELDDEGRLRLVLEFGEESGKLSRRTAHDAEGRRRELETFHANGSSRQLTRWDENGLQTYDARWSEDGQLRNSNTSRFEGRTLVAHTERRAGGQLALVVEPSGTAAILSCTLFGEGGLLEAKGFVRDERLCGSWQLFADGALRSVVDLDLQQRRPSQASPDDDDDDDDGLTFEYDSIAWKLNKALFDAWLATTSSAAPNTGLEWVNVAGAYGDSAHLPNCFAALSAPEPRVRHYALATISGAIEHQGSVYPATAKAIPLLVAALAEPNVDQSGVLDLLRQVGEAAAPYRQEVAELDEDDEGRIGIEGTLDALAKAWPALRVHLSNPADAAQLQVLQLAKFGPSEQVLNDVVSLGQSPDTNVRACIANLAIDLGAPAPHIARWFDDADPLVRTVAAIALVLHQGGELPPEFLPRVEAALSDAVENIPVLEARYNIARPDDAALPAMLAVAASIIRSPALQDLAPALCPHLTTANAFGAADVFARGLLQLVLGTDASPPYSNHSLEVLRTIVASEPVWMFNVNAAEAMQGFCLPSTRDELSSLLAQMEAAADPNAVLHERIQALSV